MRHRFGKLVVVALGGSIVYPEEIDVQFIARFSGFVRRFLKRRMRFVVVVGGGRLARLFQEAAGRISRITDEDRDWIGIHATRLNAHLLRTVFRDVADPVIADIRGKVRKPKYPVTIASGWRPGWSTDYVAVQLAADFGVGQVVVAGSPSYVYDRDYRSYKNAKRFGELSWVSYRRLIPRIWKPGLHAPVDPVAARLAHKEKIAAIVINGRDLKNFERLLRGGEFQGTIIS